MKVKAFITTLLFQTEKKCPVGNSRIKKDRASLTKTNKRLKAGSAR